MPKEFGVSNRNVDSQRFRPKVKEAISFEVAFLVSATPPPRKHTRAGYLDGRGIGSRSVKVLSLGRRVLLRERGT
jgi:hypothetical protein